MANGTPPGQNIDLQTVRDFGKEWKHFDQKELPEAELRKHFDRYFRIFPWDTLPPNAEGFDLGCGSGRWARFVAEKVGLLHCVDASEAALDVAQATLASRSNCRFHCASVDAIPLVDGTMDFGYSLGVLHHVPDSLAGLRACVVKLRPGAPFLVYLYYALDGRPLWFRTLWRMSDLVRRSIAPQPHAVKLALTFPIALLVYLPLSRFAKLVERIGMRHEKIPLSYYRNASFYTLRTDALDRFGTRLERRFTANQVRELMIQAGLSRVEVGSREPFWCAVGVRSSQ